MRRYTETERQRIVRAFESSGVSATAFCRRRGVSTVTLAHWRKRYPQSAAASSPVAARPAAWLPVMLTDAGSPSLREASRYLMVRGDCRLEVPTGFAPGEVRQLWQLLADGRPALTESRES